MNLDPKAEAVGQIQATTFGYAMNNPVFYVDPDGNCPPGVVCNPIVKGTWTFLKGFGNGAKNTYNFVTRDAWKSETWKSMTNLVAGSFAEVTLTPVYGDQTSNIVDSHTNGAVSNFSNSVNQSIDKVKNGNLEPIGELAFDALLGKGVGNLKKLKRAKKASKNTKLSNVLNKKFDLDPDSFENIGNLEGSVDLGWYDGETAYFSIDGINKGPNPKGSAFGELTSYAEELAKQQGLSEVTIDFNVVMNGRLGHDPSWARQYGYHYSSRKVYYSETQYTLTVTWTKILE